MDQDSKTIVIVGAGIAGLVAAWQSRITIPNSKVILLEASDRAGGILQTESDSGYCIESAADMFTTEPDCALELCRSLGRESELMTTRSVPQRAFVATEDGIEPVPDGLSLMLPGNLDAIRDSSLLDAGGLERFFQEQSVAAHADETDEDFQSFVVRRFGQQAFDNLIQPLVSGIYTADPSRLSMRATMKRFVEMEKSHGSLIDAAEARQSDSADRSASGARYDLFRAPRNGIGSLVDWLLECLESFQGPQGVEIHYDWPVDSVQKTGDQWNVTGSGRSVLADGVVVATPAAIAAKILRSQDISLSAALGGIETASAAVIVLAFDEAQIRRKFAGYGIVIPACLKRKLIAASFSSNKFENRAPDGKLLVRCFAGGAMQGELVDLPDQQLIDLAVSELNWLIGIDGQPELKRVIRWRNAMPQYHVGHLDRVAAIEAKASEHPTLQLAGNSYHGVGIPVCVRSGKDAIERLATALAGRV